MSTVWFTSDIHFGHPLVAKLRGFEDDLEAHHATLATNWSKAVGEDDVVWVLGDLALSKWSEALEWVKSLPGRKRLILGNHDKAHPQHRDAHKYQRAYLEAFEFVQPFARVRINQQLPRGGTAFRNALLSHYPYTADRGYESRDPQWRLPNLGGWLLHGHTHAVSRVTSDTEIHVGLDAWNLTPVNVELIALMMNAMKGPR
jgi:calcineurin-like phosphoesterase family protein